MIFKIQTLKWLVWLVVLNYPKNIQQCASAHPIIPWANGSSLDLNGFYQGKSWVKHNFWKDYTRFWWLRTWGRPKTDKKNMDDLGLVIFWMFLLRDLGLFFFWPTCGAKCWWPGTRLFFFGLILCHGHPSLKIPMFFLFFLEQNSWSLSDDLGVGVQNINFQPTKR